MHFELKKFTDQDIPFLFSVYASTRQEELKKSGWSDVEKHDFLSMQFDLQLKQYQEHFPNAQFDIILVDGKPAGRLYVDRSTNDILIIDIALLPHFKGKKIGYHFMRQLMDEGQKTGKPVKLHVEKFNPAKNFYDRLGFKAFEDLGAYWFMEWSPDKQTHS